MKKIGLFILLSMIISTGAMYAEDSNLTNPQDSFLKTTPKVQAAPEEDLVDFDLNSLKERLYNLEQRVRDLEQDLRFQDDKVDSLERSLDDVKRRHLR